MALDEATKKQADIARQQIEAEMDKKNLDEELKEKLRSKLDQKILSEDVARGAPTNDYFGFEKWDEAVNRYRGLGARQRGAVQLDQTQTNALRGQQLGSLGLLETAAQGGAPSQATNLHQIGAEQAREAAARGMAGARGAGAQVAGLRGSLAGYGAGSLANTQSATTMAAGEAAADRGALSGAATGVRGQDIGAATTNASLLAKSRAQDEARQQAYERMGWNTRQTQLGSNIELQRQEDAKKAELRALQRAEATRDSGAGKSAAQAGMAAGMMALSFLSDVRSKERPMPVGSLARYEK